MRRIRGVRQILILFQRSGKRGAPLRAALPPNFIKSGNNKKKMLVCEVKHLYNAVLRAVSSVG